MLLSFQAAMLAWHVHPPMLFVHLHAASSCRTSLPCMKHGRRRSGKKKPDLMPASSHSKTKNNWRHTRATAMSASGAIAYPSCLQTDNLPAVAEHNRRLPNGRYPALVLNADFTPLSCKHHGSKKAAPRQVDASANLIVRRSVSLCADVPLSLWSWQDSVRAVYRDVVTVLSYYDIAVRS